MKNYLSSQNQTFLSKLSDALDALSDPVQIRQTALDIIARHLTIETADKTQAQLALHESEEKYRAIFNSINEGFTLLEILFDDNGHANDVIIRDANPAQHRVDGIRALIGKRVREILPDIEQKWIDRYGNVIKTGLPEKFYDWSEANQRWYDVNATRVGDANSRLVAIVYNDITERKQAEERQAFMLKLSDVLRPLSDTLVIQDEVTRLTREHFGLDRCYYCEVTGGNLIIRKEAAADDLPSIKGTYPLNGVPVYEQTLKEGQPFVVNDVHLTDRFDELLRQTCIGLQIISFINIPVIKDGKPAGIFCFVQRKPRQWHPYEVDIAVEITERTWAAVERAHIEQTLREVEMQKKVKQMEAEQQLEIVRVSMATLEEERYRISESLHNGLGQVLYGVKISLSGLKQEQSVQEFGETMNYTSKLLTDAINETRRISHELMPTTLEEFGLKAAIEDICLQFQSSVKFDCQIRGLNSRLEKYLELAVYRTVQELMMNVVKHAHATRALVEIAIKSPRIVLRITDNGRGMGAAKKDKTGIGLTTIRSKIKLLNGEVNITSGAGKGTAVEVIIPMG